MDISQNIGIQPVSSQARRIWQVDSLSSLSESGLDFEIIQYGSKIVLGRQAGIP